MATPPGAGGWVKWEGQGGEELVAFGSFWTEEGGAREEAGG